MKLLSTMFALMALTLFVTGCTKAEPEASSTDAPPATEVDPGPSADPAADPADPAADPAKPEAAKKDEAKPEAAKKDEAKPEAAKKDAPKKP
ncbi:MAG: hypothetical protein K0U86_16855 [Planctomycetes bacterium]|nr:hypothetical protein [Planctomycetota bacterium]MCH9726572.1 hypothetical protein [Planctomycetota bacterium]MCH9779241.1 hypothetical protein [Planctomycetota bacterium]MCH9790109.1 hypothetical protein [Planctomycetota bacterium]